jgi:urease alpha subunit
LQRAHVIMGWARDHEGDDNARVLRYLAKVTAEPARVLAVEPVSEVPLSRRYLLA